MNLMTFFQGWFAAKLKVSNLLVDLEMVSYIDICLNVKDQKGPLILWFIIITTLVYAIYRLLAAKSCLRENLIALNKLPQLPPTPLTTPPIPHLGTWHLLMQVNHWLDQNIPRKIKQLFAKGHLIPLSSFGVYLAHTYIHR